jgi:hypothetical protein
MFQNMNTDIDRKPSGSLGHAVYRKMIHTNFYLNAKPYHHLENKHPVLSTLAHRARAIAICGEVNFNSSVVHSKRMATVTDLSGSQSTQKGKIQPERI